MGDPGRQNQVVSDTGEGRMRYGELGPALRAELGVSGRILVAPRALHAGPTELAAGRPCTTDSATTPARAAACTHCSSESRVRRLPPSMEAPADPGPARSPSPS